MAFIYQADCYCDDCGQEIRNRLDAEGKCPENPNNEYTYDSDEYPKRASDDDESDCPQHCGSHEDCCNAHVLPSGRKIGCLIGTSLTSDGVRYLQEYIDEGGEVAEFWYDEFSAAGYDLKKPVANKYPGGVCPDCQTPIPSDAEAGDECDNCGHIFTKHVDSTALW